MEVDHRMKTVESTPSGKEKHPQPNSTSTSSSSDSTASTPETTPRYLTSEEKQDDAVVGCTTSSAASLFAPPCLDPSTIHELLRPLNKVFLNTDALPSPSPSSSTDTPASSSTALLLPLLTLAPKINPP